MTLIGQQYGKKKLRLTSKEQGTQVPYTLGISRTLIILIISVRVATNLMLSWKSIVWGQLVG